MIRLNRPPRNVGHPAAAALKPKAPMAVVCSPVTGVDVKENRLSRPGTAWMGLAGAALVAGVAGLVALAARGVFAARLDRLERRLAEGPPAGQPRADLPPEVLALAWASGAQGSGAPAAVDLRQSGWMWRAPGGDALAFTARQRIATAAPGFMWRAVMDPAGSVVVADYFVGGHGGLEARLLGAVRVAAETGSADIDRGEALRYLAELPWNPDAILHNRALEWRVIDSTTILAALGHGPGRAEITFTLGADGLVEAASAAARICIEGGRRVERPWRGRFWDYRRMAHRLVPIQGEVAWVRDEGEFVYWRGRIEAWGPGPST